VILVPGHDERPVTVATSAIREFVGYSGAPLQTVTITLLTKAQVPAGGVTVMLRNVETGGEQKDGTSANTGTANFYSVVPGRYVIRAPGYEDLNVTVSNAAIRETLRLSQQP
jgi:hypothetical protein